ncbi:MAG TPA: class I SAM-dependent methyltransferase, partial [Phycisphaerae bacterium]|nr:class I SAM-dependent methyltransferase [Phycisphaerae bacterium]
LCGKNPIMNQGNRNKSKKSQPLLPTPDSRLGKAAPPAAASDWSHVADWYDQLIGEQGTSHQQKTIIPGTLRLLDLTPGQKVLDIACGQGVLCRALAQKGISSVGIDLADSLISAARQRQTNPAIEQYHVADARKLQTYPFISPGSFDAAVCILAIQNMTPLSPIWQGVRHALKPSGSLVIVMMHPCFRIPQKSSWQWDNASQSQYRRIDSYLSSEKIPIAMHPGSNPDQTTLSFHRPLQAYINTLGSAGLWIDRVEEWISHKLPPEGKKFAALDKIRREIPLFLALRARAAASSQ